jgi:Concanavalin A-like lectin/glucanases superfamily
MHGRDHCPGGADPIPCLGGLTRDSAAWQNAVDSHGPLFEIYFQDDPAPSNRFADITGNLRHLIRASFGDTATRISRSTVAHLFADQTYSGETFPAYDNSFGTIGQPGNWSEGLDVFTAELWFKKKGHDRGILMGNNVYTGPDLANFWGVGFDAAGALYLRRFGELFTGSIPPLGEWHQYVVVGDATTVTLYYDGVAVGVLNESAGANPGDIVVCAREGITNIPALYETVSGYYGAIVGYTDALTAAEVNALYLAGLQAGNPAETELPGTTPGPQGPAGPAGPEGPAGPGVPVGGTAGQVLTKDTTTDYDTSWQSPAAGTGGVTVKDNGAVVGTRAGLNFHEGAGILLSFADDAANNEVDITVDRGYPDYAALKAGVTNYADILA